MGEFSTKELLEWVSIFRDIDERETEEPRFCVFVDSDPDENFFKTGIAEGFSTAAEAAKRRVEYYDYTIFKDVEKVAYHIGQADELCLQKLTHLAACYVPEYIGKSEDGYFIVIGHFKDEENPHTPRLNYSLDQQIRVSEWLSVLTWIDTRQNVILTQDIDEMTTDLLSTYHFVDEKKRADRSALYGVMSYIFFGRAEDIDTLTINRLADWDFERVYCSNDGVLALLGTEVDYSD